MCIIPYIDFENWTEINRRTIKGDNPLKFEIENGVNPKTLKEQKIV